MSKKKKLTQGGVRREFAADIDFLTVLLQNNAKPRPENDFQALMETAPGDPIPETVEGLQVLREAVVDCIDCLSDNQITIINGVFFEKATYQELADRLGYKSKETVRRQLDIALRDMQVLMERHPVIQEWLDDNSQ